MVPKDGWLGVSIFRHEIDWVDCICRLHVCSKLLLSQHQPAYVMSSRLAAIHGRKILEKLRGDGWDFTLDNPIVLPQFPLLMLVNWIACEKISTCCFGYCFGLWTIFRLFLDIFSMFLPHSSSLPSPRLLLVVAQLCSGVAPWVKLCRLPNWYWHTSTVLLCYRTVEISYDIIWFSGYIFIYYTIYKHYKYTVSVWWFNVDNLYLYCDWTANGSIVHIVFLVRRSTCDTMHGVPSHIWWNIIEKIYVQYTHIVRSVD